MAAGTEQLDQAAATVASWVQEAHRENKSRAQLFAELSAAERAIVLDKISEEALEGLKYDWRWWARPSQQPPSGAWTTWVFLAGRGSGKTRAGSEWINAETEAGTFGRVALVAPTADDARAVIVEGPSGILATARPWHRPVYQPTRHQLTWPNGAIATTYSADEPERLRGPQHDLSWCDELAAWRYPETWDMLQFGMRGGLHPRSFVTTTPRPTPIIREFVRDAARMGSSTVITRDTTYANRAHLPIEFLAKIIRKYEGTRLGRQELRAEVLEDFEGALWNHRMIDDERKRAEDIAFNANGRPQGFPRIVVAVDPAMTVGEDANETGIIVAARDTRNHAYILGDYSGRYTPLEWAAKTVQVYKQWHADRVIAETNNGGDMVEATMRMVDPSLSYEKVTATRGKFIRAEPVAALYEQKRVHHVGVFPQLEDQMCAFMVDPKNRAGAVVSNETSSSPDRVDALVWGLSNLLVGEDVVDLSMWARLGKR